MNKQQCGSTTQIFGSSSKHLRLKTSGLVLNLKAANRQSGASEEQTALSIIQLLTRLKTE